MTQGQGNVTLIPKRSLKSVRGDIFAIDNKHYLCILDDHSKFSVMKQLERFSAKEPDKNLQNYIFRILVASKIISVAGKKLYFRTVKNFFKRLSF